MLGIIPQVLSTFTHLLCIWLHVYVPQSASGGQRQLFGVIFLLPPRNCTKVIRIHGKRLHPLSFLTNSSTYISIYLPTYQSINQPTTNLSVYLSTPRQAGLAGQQALEICLSSLPSTGITDSGYHTQLFALLHVWRESWRSNSTLCRRSPQSRV